MIYSIWKSKDNITIVPGVDQPRYINGKLQDKDSTLIIAFTAENFHEAIKIYDEMFESGEIKF